MTIAAILGIDVTAQSTTPEFIPGQLGVVTGSTGTKIYKYLKYDDGTAAVDGVAGEVNGKKYEIWCCVLEMESAERAPHGPRPGRPRARGGRRACRPERKITRTQVKRGVRGGPTRRAPPLTARRRRGPP